MPSTDTQVRKILLIGPGDPVQRGVVESLAGGGQIVEAQSLDEARWALHAGGIDLVIGSPSDLRLEGDAARLPQATTILESIAQGVCIVDQGDGMVWANQKMHTFPPVFRDTIVQQCRAALADRANPSDIPRARHFNLATDNDMYFEVSATPVLNAHAHVTQMAAVAWDMTLTQRLQRKLDAIDKAGREIVELQAENVEALNVEERLRLLEQKIYNYMHDLLHFDNFAVMLIDKKTEKLEFVLQHGFPDRVRTMDLYARAEGNGISGYVAATGRSYICPDTQKDARYLPGLDLARSSLTVPLRLHNEVVGVFDVESEQPAAFNEDDRQYIEILGRYIAVALNVLELLITERHSVTGRLADDVATEIAGPLNDIVTNASTLREEYIGHEDLRQRLDAICGSVSVIRKAVREVASPKGGVWQSSRDMIERDPLLSGKRVLVADDEEIIRETISGVLMKFGCEVDTVKDGAAAIALVGQNTYDLIIADIKMPNRNGYEVFAAARDNNPHLPVMLMTGFGYDPNHSIVRARREGLAAVLFKPFKVDQLLEEVRRALSPTPAPSG